MAIPEQFIEELAARCDITDVVSSYLPLKRKGANLWGLCPFHGEKTPSFSVSPDKQIFHCFGCGKGGGVIRFVQEMERLTFPEAVRLLAGKAGMELPDEGEDARAWRTRRARLLEATKLAARFYYDTLHSDAGKRVAEYIQKRGISPKYAARFGLGAAPDGWDALLTALTAKGFEKSELLEAGLVAAGKNGGFYDKFRNRLMLPVIDLRGDVIGFSSRVMDDGTPKYLNTPETPIFKKRSVLYGMHLAKQSKRGNLLLVEGNIDVISLHQAGFDNAVATMGTALTDEHAKMMARYVKELIVCYDNDAAGADATQRAIALLRNSEFTVRILELPRRQDASGALVKQDPDDFITAHGAGAFEHLMSGSENQTAYRLGVIRAKYDLNDDAGRAGFLQEAAEMIATLQSAVEREIYAGRAAETAGISRDAMAREVETRRRMQIARARKQTERKASTPASTVQPKSRDLRYQNVRSARAEGGVLRLAVSDPSLLAHTARLDAEWFSVPLYAQVFALLSERWRAGKPVSIAALEGTLTSEEMDELAAALGQEDLLANASAALDNYIEIIQTEALKRGGDLLAVQDRLKQKKGYGGRGL